MLKSQGELLKLTSSLEKAGDQGFCANCNTKTANLTECSTLARVYFRVPKDRQSWKLCRKCGLTAAKFEKESKREIKSNGNLFSAWTETPSDYPEFVDLEPIEEQAAVSAMEADGKSTSSSTSLYSVSEDVVTKEINDYLRRFSIVGHTKKLKATLADEIDALASGFAETNKLMEQLSISNSELTKNVNKLVTRTHAQIQLGTVDISDDGSVEVQEDVNLATMLKLVGIKEHVSDEVKDFRRTANASIKKKSQMKVEQGLMEVSLIKEIKIPKDASHHRNQNCENTPPAAPKHNLKRRLKFRLPLPNTLVYAMCADLLSFWVPAKLISVTELEVGKSVVTVQLQNVESYLKRRETNSQNLSRNTTQLFGKQIAFTKPVTGLQLPVGTRVIAKFNDVLGNHADMKGLFYAGIVAEERDLSNHQRYLIFFDDGYPQYSKHEEVLPVLEVSESVWNDVHIDAQDFVKNFLNCQNQKLLEAKVGHQYKIEYDGKWVKARVMEIDCSMMKVQYSEYSRLGYEWIYLGSPRIQYIHQDKTRTSGKTSGVDIANDVKTLENRKDKSGPMEMSRSRSSTDSCLKKNTSNDGCLFFETAGSTQKIQIPKNCPSPREYIVHVCSPSCALAYVDEEFRKISPLAIPFHLGWAREFRGARLGSVAYNTPCGLRLTKYDEIHAYNRKTENNLPIEFFSLEPAIDCLNEFKPDRQLVFIKDISYDKEWTPVQCVNSINYDEPELLEYLSHRKAGDGVIVNNDDGFMVCCDCVDDCKDKTKCACWQLTLSGLSFKKKSSLRGYEHRRLKDWVESGIYECNHKCKCQANTCLNRVVQSKVKWPVQVYKTAKKGWGVRALHDIPRGSFLCVYTGQLLNDAAANQEGLLHGDEYLADLDYVEVMEAQKEGYESDCSDIGDDEDEMPSQIRPTAIKRALQVARKSTAGRDQPPVVHLARKSSSGRKEGAGGQFGKSDGLEMEPQQNGYQSSNGHQSSRKSSRAVQYRSYFGKSEQPYSVDGKRFGNFGRYFNHSCDPNVFIQNIFVDTHDLRFPWVAFFTCKDVKAGIELCWDYKYQVGSVPGKVLNCYCGSKNCRERLL